MVYIHDVDIVIPLLHTEHSRLTASMMHSRQAAEQKVKLKNLLSCDLMTAGLIPRDHYSHFMAIGTIAQRG